MLSFNAADLQACALAFSWPHGIHKAHKIMVRVLLRRSGRCGAGLTTNGNDYIVISESDHAAKISRCKTPALIASLSIRSTRVRRQDAVRHGRSRRLRAHLEPAKRADALTFALEPVAVRGLFLLCYCLGALAASERAKSGARQTARLGPAHSLVV